MEHGVGERVETRLEVVAGPTALQGLSGFLPQIVCLSVLEVKEGKKQTGIEIESLRGRLALALRLKKDKVPAFRKHTA